MLKITYLYLSSSTISSNTSINKINYYSSKMFLRFSLVKTPRIIHHTQLLLTKYWTNDVESAARYRLLNRWPRKLGDKAVLPLMSGKKNYKERSGKTASRTGKYFQWKIKQLLNSALVIYEEFRRSWRPFNHLGLRPLLITPTLACRILHILLSVIQWLLNIVKKKQQT